jgi:ML domain
MRFHYKNPFAARKTHAYLALSDREADDGLELLALASARHRCRRRRRRRCQLLCCPARCLWLPMLCAMLLLALMGYCYRDTLLAYFRGEPAQSDFPPGFSFCDESIWQKIEGSPEPRGVQATPPHPMAHPMTQPADEFVRINTIELTPRIPASQQNLAIKADILVKTTIPNVDIDLKIRVHLGDDGVPFIYRTEKICNSSILGVTCPIDANQTLALDRNVYIPVIPPIDLTVYAWAQYEEKRLFCIRYFLKRI